MGIFVATHKAFDMGFKKSLQKEKKHNRIDAIHILIQINHLLNRQSVHNRKHGTLRTS
jgi:hypothetical protein